MASINWEWEEWFGSHSLLFVSQKEWGVNQMSTQFRDDPQLMFNNSSFQKQSMATGNLALSTKYWQLYVHDSHLSSQLYSLVVQSKVLLGHAHLNLVS